MFYLLILGLLINLNLAQANCGDMKLPFDDRVQKSGLIFIGIPISDDAAEKSNEKYDRVVKVSVKEKFKGHISVGEIVSIHYKKIVPRIECQETAYESFAPFAKAKSQMLFYTKKLNSIQFISYEWVCGEINRRECKDELKKLKERF